MLVIIQTYRKLGYRAARPYTLRSIADLREALVDHMHPTKLEVMTGFSITCDSGTGALFHAEGRNLELVLAEAWDALCDPANALPTGRMPVVL